MVGSTINLTKNSRFYLGRILSSIPLIYIVSLHCCCHQNSFSCFKRSSSEVSIGGISKVDIKTRFKKEGQMS